MKERQKLVTDEQWELIETNAWLGQFRCLLVRPEHFALHLLRLLVSGLPLDHS